MEDDFVLDDAASEDGSATCSGSEASVCGSTAGSPAVQPRVSLGSLMDPGSGSGAPEASATLPCGEDPPAAAPDEMMAEDAEDCLEFGDGSSWFNPSHLPGDVQEVLSWHPNRVRATVIMELQHRLQHLRPHRVSKKKFDPILTLHKLSEGHSVESTEDLRRPTKEIYGRNLYTRMLAIISGQPWRNLQKTHHSIWSQCRKEDKKEWCTLWRIMTHVNIQKYVVLPRRRPGRRMDEAVLQQETAHNGESFAGYGFLLSYNTDLGQADPDVIKLVQSGKSCEDLYKAMRGMAIYQEAFTELWEHANKIAVKMRLGTINLAMEHSSQGDHEARVHFHVFMGPDLRSGVGFGWNPVLAEVNSRDLQWRGIVPHVKASRPQKRSWNQIYNAVAVGSYYVAGPKIGSIMKRSTYKPIEDIRATCSRHPTVPVMCVSVFWFPCPSFHVFLVAICGWNLSGHPHLLSHGVRMWSGLLDKMRPGLPDLSQHHLEPMENPQDVRRRLREGSCQVPGQRCTGGPGEFGPDSQAPEIFGRLRRGY